MAYIDNVTNILQIQPDGLPTFVRLSQNENGRNLYFQLAGNEIDIPANATITISGTKPDGTVYSGTGSISDNVILIPEMIQMTAVAGYWDAKVKIISGGNTIATGRIRFVIDADTVDPDSVPSDSELEGLVAEAQQYAETARTEAYGSPLTAQTAAGMTDHTRVYVYTGSESGYTAGHWYYWDDTQWADGGIYNSTATNTDPTLTLAGVAADAKATGDAIEAARVAIDDTLTNEGEAADAAAVGSEISGLKEDLSDEPYNYTVDQTLIVGEYVKSSTGEILENGSYSRTGYIDIKDASSITLKWTSTPTGSTNALCFYDSEKIFISGVNTPLSTSDSSKTYSFPANTKYVICSGTKYAMPLIDLTLNNIQPIIYKIKTELNDKVNLEELFNKRFIDEPVLLQNVIGVTKFPYNLIINEECLDNAYINVSAGSIVFNHSNYFCTGYIPVTAGQTYRSNLGRNYAWYDSSKTYISGNTGTSIQSGITAPSDASYIRFTINKTTDGIDNPIYLYFADTLYYNESVVIQGLVATETTPWCYGKKINWIGDSIVDGQDFDEEVCSALGLIKSNEYGINGSTIALKGDGTDGRNALCERYDDMSDDADIIAVSCGTNDFEYAWCPIGTIDDPDDGTSNTTFYGALKALCKGLIDKYPQKVIFFTTPIKRAQAFANGDGGEYTADGVMITPFSKNKYGKTLMDYADIIKEVCGYYSIPVLDMYRESLLNPHLSSQQNMFDNVYTHPNSAGQKIMARRVCGWITQLGYTISGLN